MVTKTAVLGLTEGILHIISMLFGLGGFIASIAVLFTIGNIDIFDEDVADDTDPGEDRDRFRNVGGWVMSANFAALILQLLLAINFTCIYFRITKTSSVIFGYTCYVLIMLLAIGLVAGAASISANFRDVQVDYIDKDSYGDCETILDPPANITVTDEEEEQCQFILRLRISQNAAGAMSYLGTITCVVLSVFVMINFIIARDRSTVA